MAAPPLDRSCQCFTGVDCLATSVGGTDQCPADATQEDLLCDGCRAIPPGEHGFRPRHCHTCGHVRTRLAEPGTGLRRVRAPRRDRAPSPMRPPATGPAEGAGGG